MKKIILQSLGIAIGAALYELYMRGATEFDWYKPVFIFSFVLLSMTVYRSFKKK